MSDSTPIGYGLVGTGSIADFHAVALAQTEGANLRAVCSRNQAQAEVFAQRHGTEVASDLVELLARRDIDVVCITTPSGAHGEVVLAALAAGKHVLCEKPLEITVKRIDRLLAAARRYQRLLAVVMPARFGHGARAVKTAVDQGRFGRLTLCSAYVKWWRSEEYYASSNWRGTRALDGGGALMNQGIHAVDLLQWFAGPPQQVSALAARLAHPTIEVEDSLVASLKFTHGALGVIECATSCFPGFTRKIELCGTKGSVVLEDDGVSRWEFAEPHPSDEVIRAAQSRGNKGGAADPRAIGTEGHRLVIENMTRAIREGTAPAVSGEDARLSVAIIEEIYRSAEALTGQVWGAGTDD